MMHKNKLKILIEIPTWLGDCVMATPAIENIVKHYPDVKITIFGAYVSTAIFEDHPNVEEIIVDESKRSKMRSLWLYNKVKELGDFDVAVSFRESFASKLFIFFAKAKSKAVYKRDKTIERHQVERYNDLVNTVFDFRSEPEDLKVYFEPFNYEKPTLGINPGASYGSAKRWYPEKFAEVAIALSKHYDIVIFGGPSEVDIAKDIENELKKAKSCNYQNMAGKTSIKVLCQKIAGLDLFITGDSGPMHVAAAFSVPTVAIFGPTKDKETNQWKNPKGVIVKKEMECAPCMKRTCPLKHHECMKLIEAEDVLEAVKSLT
jgi:heptosyltransferase-2